LSSDEDDNAKKPVKKQRVNLKDVSDSEEEDAKVHDDYSSDWSLEPSKRMIEWMGMVSSC
jgi:hypothetical protein